MKDCKYEILPCSTLFEESDEYFPSILQTLQQYLKNQDWNINEKKSKKSGKKSTPQYSPVDSNHDLKGSNDNNKIPLFEVDEEKTGIERKRSQSAEIPTGSGKDSKKASGNDSTRTRSKSHKKPGIFGKIRRVMTKQRFEKENTLILGIDSHLNNKLLQIFSKLFQINVTLKEVPMLYQWQYVKSSNNWCIRKWNVFNKTNENFVVYQHAVCLLVIYFIYLVFFKNL